MLRRSFFVCLFLLPVVAFAQTADLEVVSAVDAPDPVTPGGTLTYTVTLTNHGPDAAPGGGVNINLPLAVTHQNSSGPGFTCVYFGSSGTCNMASLPVGTYVVTVNVTVNASLASFPDQDITAQFLPSGTASDPNPGNNSKSATTTVDSPQVDLSLTATDSPDPVFPDGTVTYTVNLTNSGPDPATSVNFNVVPNPSLAFQSVSVPAGWSCAPPASGALNATFTCSRASWPVGTSQFTVVFKANDENFGITDTSFDTYFGVFAGASDETDDGNDNDETVSTQYVTPDADINITATDSPDPVGPDGDITYTVTVTNQGPNTPTNTTFEVIGNGGQTRFVSLSAPGGWSCNPPAPGTLINVAGFQCTHPSFSNGSVAVFTVVTEASDDLHSNTDHNIAQAFQAFGNISDPDNTDNQVTVTTAFVVNDADMNITATDSPDPVSPDGDITYTVTVTNQGPDPATDAKMILVGNGGQSRFQSISAPAGWTCAMPPAGTMLNVTSYECTHPSLPINAPAVFTVVLEASDDLHSNVDHNIFQNFTTSANEFDGDQADNTAAVTTLYDVSNADISVTNTDSPDPVAPGDTITYSQSITNSGPEAAPNATFSQSTPAGTTFQSISAPAGWSCTTPASGATGAITCTKSSMAVSETGAFTVVVNVTGAGSIVSEVVGSSSASDPDPVDNEASTVTTSIAPTTADLSITKSTTATSAPQGSTVTYTIVVTNNGPDAASDVVMTDELPASLLFRSITTPSGFSCTTPAVGASGTITCTAATLANGASRTFTLVVEVAASSGTIINGASVASASNDPDSGDSDATAPGFVAGPPVADLEITKSTNSSTAPPGGTVTYTITVTNDGPSDATNVVVTDDLPAGLTLISATPSQGTCNATDPVSCNLGTILNGGSATITLTAQVTATSGTISNTASVTSTEGGTDTATTPPIPVGDAELAAVPTLSEWALLMLALMLGVAAAVKMRA